METPTELLHDLATLDDALGDDSDLAARLDTVVRLLVDAVPTLVAVAITVRADGYSLAIGAAPNPPARTSMAITITSGGVGSELVAHATDLEAFNDFRADAIHRSSIHPDAITLDAHLGEDMFSTRLTDLSVSNQAIGILVDRGHPPDEARTELEQRADAAGQTTLDHARALIADVSSGRPPNPP